MRRALLSLGFALVLAACGGGGPAHTRAARHQAGGPAPPSVPVSAGLLSGSRLLLDAQEPLSTGYAAGGSLYLAHTVPAAEHTAEIYAMTRLDPTSGRTVAVRRFFSTLDDTLLAGRSLWVTTSLGNATTLWRLDPHSLAVRSKVPVPSSWSTEGLTGSLAAAGGHLWVGAGKLDRVSLATGRVDRVIDPSPRSPVQLAADPRGPNPAPEPGLPAPDVHRSYRPAPVWPWLS
ncbi:MAG TPA: hypothetical protein VG186_01165 [Solirubrobacteraceae bacterium]|nr:hypothetical protein [Solirubrobacteraceae bacterium]